MRENTLQFGGRFQLTASVEVLTAYPAEGWFGINVLLVFQPFKIVAGARAGVSISAGDRELMGVTLRAHLEGPDDFGFDIGTRPGGEPGTPTRSPRTSSWRCRATRPGRPSKISYKSCAAATIAMRAIRR